MIDFFSLNVCFTNIKGKHLKVVSVRFFALQILSFCPFYFGFLKPIFNMQFLNYSHCFSLPQPVVCERSMGDVVTKTYPRYVITTDQTIQRQVLCETQTDGGGWIVIQVRPYNDSYRTANL